ncbi:XrtA/PEP-CTERM system TPR-repeat protein PrsT [Malonomonas rubra]|uniref:XrtA/PEP-CTERM system TPR-repeat protein PrsT n=1 Tax=Malonomonas rubra TaxID=57040 RepID=UPI000933555A|nr:XrtA/PEP-CTERM system TPR-repeat protein PrsT [Malonomonas rubra]
MRVIFLFICFLLVACSSQTKEELLQEGNRLRDQGNFRGAIVLYKSSLEKDANYVDARFELADAYLNSGNFSRAEKEFQKVLHQNPSNTGAQLKLATVYIQQRQPEKALLELDKYHTANSETAESAVLYGLAHGASGDLGSAKSFFSKALQLDGKSTDARINLAKVALQEKDLDRARSYLQEVLSIDSGNIAAYYLLANIENRAGQREEALKVYQDLLTVDGKQLEALYMSGILQMDLGDMVAAEATVGKLATSFPKQAASNRLKGMLLYRQSKFEEAVIPLQEALKTEQHPLSFFFLGMAYFSLEQYEQALSQFQKSLDISADFDRARLLVAMTLLKQKRIDDAIIEVKRVLDKDPENAYARNILGSAYLATGQYDQGMEELEAATELDPSMADAHLKQGLFHLAKGEGELGEAGLVNAVNAAPEVLNSRLMLVTHYLRQKNYSSAIETLQTGLNGSATDALLNNYLAAAYFSQKKPNEAIAALNKAKEVKPDYLTPYFNLASYYVSQAEYPKAETEYNQILEQQNDNLKAYLGLASLYAVQGQSDKVDQVFGRIEAVGDEQSSLAAAQYKVKKRDFNGALETVDNALQQHTASAPLLALKGALHKQEKNVEAAESAFISLSGLSPEQGTAQLVALYLANNQLAKAESLVAESLQKSPELEYPYLLSSTVSLSKKDGKGAVETLQEGISKAKNPLRLLMRLAQIFDAAGRIQQAEQIYQGIIDKAPRFPDAYASLATIKERVGDKGEALELYRKTLRYDRNNALALNNLAYLLVTNFGEPKEALTHAMAVYRLQPGDPRVMDTLGYVLLKNERYKDAANLLTKAHELLPQVSTITLHLAMAKQALGEKAEAKELLQQIVDAENKDDAAQAKQLLKAL